MALHLSPFVGCERASFAEDLFWYGELAEIVEQSGPVDDFEIRAGKFAFYSDCACDRADAFGVFGGTTVVDGHRVLERR